MNPTNNHADTAAPTRSANGTCTSPAEVRDFLAAMKGKDPDEVLGAAATFSLRTAMAQATILTLVLMVGFTVGPLVYGKIHTTEKPSAAKPADKEAAPATPEPAKTPPTAAAKTPSTAKAAAPTGKEFLDKIGATDTKTASPKANPLDKSSDDLFKDIDKK